MSVNKVEESKREADQGECAECFSNNLDYGVVEVQDSCIYYPYRCRDCGHGGEEWYETEHVEQK